MDPRNELIAVDQLLAGKSFTYSVDWFRYVVLNDPSWDPATYNSSLAILADELNPFDIRTFPSALPAFKARGGKMITYHGGQDNQISCLNSDRFWTRMHVQDTQPQDYYRLFRISGMFHCGSGPGAWSFGQTNAALSAALPFDPLHNVVAAVITWVEDGEAPSCLRGTKFVNDTVALGVDFQRDHCLFPAIQTYFGGDYKSPSSWKCL
ncbi:Tannase/feruloyl esterase [Acrodontium crateriforme]|uniref:Carboxylic ester hydrolase n=1 Tax=Acrodontium crateriforme TaxID=150365 RepID=A0AAQ3M3E5_9PEZI|nr:Tannase/feruloyl esterase [Acrodontium crateriforme]